MEPVILDIKKKDILNEIVDQINTVSKVSTDIIGEIL